MKQDGGGGGQEGLGGVTKSDMKAEHEIEGEQEEMNYLGAARGPLASCSS